MSREQNGRMISFQRISSVTAQSPSNPTPAAPAESFPGRRGPFGRVLRRRTPSRLRSIFAALKDVLHEAFVTIYGEKNEAVIGIRRGYGALCLICLRDAHDVGERCPRAMIRWCVDCRRTRELDRFGNCSVCGSHSIDYRERQAPPRRRAPVSPLTVVTSSATASTPEVTRTS